MGPGGVKEASRRTNWRRRRPVGGETGGSGGGAEAPTKLEVGDEVEDLTIICKKFRGLNVN